MADIGQMRIRGEALLLFVLALVSILPLLAPILSRGKPIVLALWLALMAVLLLLAIVNGPRNPGFLVMAAGVALNFIVIALNRGMPVLPLAATIVGGPQAAVTLGRDLFHSVSNSSTAAGLLADVLPLPGVKGMRSVMSVGDVVMLVGLLLVVVRGESEPSVRRACRIRKPVEAFGRKEVQQAED